MSLDILTINYNDKNADKLFEESLKNTGFAVIKDHPISSDLINQVYEEWKNYFSSESKIDYIFDETKQDGYFPYLTENAKGSTAKDLKEFYHIYQWGRLPEMIGPKTMNLYGELTNVASTFLSWVQKNAPDFVTKLFSIPLKDMIYQSQSNLLRIIHYPPLSGNEEINSIRAAAHEDINLITLLVAGSEPGLQVMDTDGSWVNVSTSPDYIIVNIGDMLQECSNGYFPSTTHRVINPSAHNVSRYSMPFFVHARDEVQLSEKYTAKSYLEERLREIGLK